MDPMEMARRRMFLNRVIAELGSSRFEDACVYFRAKAVDPMVSWEESSVPENKDLERVPHDIMSVFDDEPMPTGWERVGLLMDLFDELPAYWLLCEAGFHYGDVSEARRTEVWHRFREWMSEDPWTHSGAAAYALHVELFEDERWTEEVWRVLVSDEPSRLLVHRVVANSASVPWGLKAPLFRDLLGDPRNHGAMAIALHGCVFNAYGKREDPEFMRMVERIHVPTGTREARMLNDILWRLGGSGSQ